MTKERSAGRRVNERAALGRGAHLRRLGACYMGIFLLILFFKNSSAAALWVNEGLRLCVTRLIPSLFPFMVVSSLVVSSGAGAQVCKPISGVFGTLMGIGADGTCAVVLGWLCGFPVGAKCAGALFDDGRIDEGEYQRIVCVSGTPSPAFLIGAVGGGMLGSAWAGALLYLISLLSAAIVGVMLRLRSGGKDTRRTTLCAALGNSHRGIAELLTGAISDAGLGMLSVCSFVVFFSAFLGVLDGALSVFSLPEEVTAVLFCVFELTTGLARVSELGEGLVFPLSALAVGWSGLSVHFQTVSVCAGRGVRLTAYFFACAMRMIICFLLAAAMGALIKIF